MVGSCTEAEVAVWIEVWAIVSWMSLAYDSNVGLKNESKWFS